MGGLTGQSSTTISKLIHFPLPTNLWAGCATHTSSVSAPPPPLTPPTSFPAAPCPCPAPSPSSASRVQAAESEGDPNHFSGANPHFLHPLKGRTDSLPVTPDPFSRGPVLGSATTETGMPRARPRLRTAPGVRGQGCVRREGPSEAAPEAVRQAVGGGCQSGWGRLLSVTNAVEVGACRQGDSGWALAGRPRGGGGGLAPLRSNASLFVGPPSSAVRTAQ